MARVFNFSPGPATLPEEVLDRVRDEVLDYDGSGMSVIETSHRGPVFAGIVDETEDRLRRLAGIPDDYAVLFIQGGATGQFAAVPLNLAPEGSTGDHLITGHWSRKSALEAERFTAVNVVADSAASGDRSIPDPEGWSHSPGAAYFAYAANETIGGVEFDDPPDVEPVLVADMSSNLLSRPLDVSRYGVIYAGAQKNLGPAGLAVVVVRRNLLGRSGRAVPDVLDWEAHARSRSLHNTPPTFTWYVIGLVLEWIEEAGGLVEMERRNRAKATLLYEAIDGSAMYRNEVEPAHRSRMNVPFLIGDGSLDDAFLSEAEAAGLANLKGHRSVGGMRASIYNAMPLAGVAALVDFMHDFESRH